MATNKYMGESALSVLVTKIKAAQDAADSVTMPEYSIVKAATATSGYLASYNLTKDGTATGVTIDIPKDLLVKSGTVETCTVADSPISGLAVGDKYIDLVVNTVEGDGSDSHLYINVTDLIDAYTAGNGITVSSANKIAVKISSTANGLSVSSSGLALAVATSTTAGAMSASDKAKLDAMTPDDYLTGDDLTEITAAEVEALF